MTPKPLSKLFAEKVAFHGPVEVEHRNILDAHLYLGAQALYKQLTPVLAEVGKCIEALEKYKSYCVIVEVPSETPGLNKFEEIWLANESLSSLRRALEGM